MKGGKGGIEAFKMRYPMSLRLGRQREEMEGAVQRWCSRAAVANLGDEGLGMRSTACSEELLLERLPYIANIQRPKGGFRAGSELEKITTFHGINAPAGEQEENDELVIEAKRDRKLMPPPAIVPGAKASGDAAAQVEDGVEKLWLSDDDIED